MRAIIRRRVKRNHIYRKEERQWQTLSRLLKPNKMKKFPTVKAGDNVSVHVKIKEGERERIQEFKGTVIRMRKGGNDHSITVRRMASNGIGVERTFLLRSPRIDKVVVERHSQVRRAQLYFMRAAHGQIRPPQTEV